MIIRPKRFHFHIGVLALLFSFLPFLTTIARAQGVGPTAEAAGIVFQTLSSEYLDAVEQQVGYRVGVYVADVKAGSAAAAAGIKMKDIIIIIGETGVDSADVAAAAIKAASGTVEVMAFTSSDEDYTPATYSLDLSGGTPTGGGGTAEGVYRDPQGRFELQPPDDWAVESSENGQSLTLTHGKAGITVLIFAGSGAAADLLDSVAKQIREQTQDYREVRSGEREVGGESAPLVEFTGVNPQEVQAHSEITACVTPGMGYVFLLSAPEGEFASVQPAWEMLLGSFKVGVSGTTPSGTIGPTAVAQGDPVSAYFDMMDFIRTEAWGRRVTTSAAERERVAALLEQDRGQMTAETQEAVAQLPQTWSGLQKAWAGASNEKKAAQRDYWRKQLLVPSQLFIPPEEHETFRGSNDRVVFDYPKDWILAQTENEGTQYLYLGPPGTEASWDQVINASTSPTGALFVVMPLDDEMKSLNSYLDGARAIAQQYVTAGAPDFKEIDALELGQDGAIVTLLGRFPGEKEDKFFWVGCVRYGPDYIFIGRVGGPTDQAETLVPAFGNALTTMELNPPGGGDDYGSAMVGYYAARAGNIATSGPW